VARPASRPGLVARLPQEAEVQAPKGDASFPTPRQGPRAPHPEPSLLPQMIAIGVVLLFVVGGVLWLVL
jgi:hypothetical protein